MLETLVSRYSLRKWLRSFILFGEKFERFHIYRTSFHAFLVCMCLNILTLSQLMRLYLCQFYFVSKCLTSQHITNYAVSFLAEKMFCMKLRPWLLPLWHKTCFWLTRSVCFRSHYGSNLFLKKLCIPFKIADTTVFVMSCPFLSAHWSDSVGERSCPNVHVQNWVAPLDFPVTFCRYIVLRQAVRKRQVWFWQVWQQGCLNLPSLFVFWKKDWVTWFDKRKAGLEFLSCMDSYPVNSNTAVLHSKSGVFIQWRLLHQTLCYLFISIVCILQRNSTGFW